MTYGEKCNRKSMKLSNINLDKHIKGSTGSDLFFSAPTLFICENRVTVQMHNTKKLTKRPVQNPQEIELKVLVDTDVCFNLFIN